MKFEGFEVRNWLNETEPNETVIRKITAVIIPSSIEMRILSRG